MDEDPAYIFRFPTPPDVGERGRWRSGRWCRAAGQAPVLRAEWGARLPPSGALHRAHTPGPCHAFSSPLPSKTRTLPAAHRSPPT